MATELTLHEAKNTGKLKALRFKTGEPDPEMDQVEIDAWWSGWREGKRYLASQLRLMLAACTEVEVYEAEDEESVSVPSYVLGD